MISQNKFDEIILFLLASDTQKIIDNLANLIIESSAHLDSQQELLGIALLAVDDAKSSVHPSSANTAYVAVFSRAKELIQEQHETIQT